MNKTRLNLLFIFVLILAGVLVFRLYELQIKEGEHWKNQAERQQKISSEVEGGRGSLFAQNKDGESIPLAINRVWHFVYIAPEEIIEEDEDQEEIISSLSLILNIDKEKIEEKMEDEDSSFEVLKRKLTEEEVKQVQELDYSGVHLREDEKRFYPQKTLASHVTGFVGGTETGQYGVEGYYNDILQGISGIEEGWRRNPGGNIITEDTAQMGMNVDLTIDYNIQFIAEKLLSESVEDFDATSGTIVVGDPNTGAILALANYPTFNPNDYRSFNVDTFKNNATQSLFEPGSVFKPIVMAMGIEEGVVGPQTTYHDDGYEKVSGYTIRNYGQKDWGDVTMTEVIEESINTGMIYVQQKLENTVFLDYLDKLGYFEKTGIDLQGEVYSENSIFKQGYDVNFANASFGQGIEVTPIQLVSSFYALANGGDLVKPYVAQNFNPEPESKGKMFSTDTTSKVTSMLISTVEEGTAKRAQIPGYHISGKTGTAQIPYSKLGENKRGYSEETIQSFIGYGPLNAEFVILVSLNQPDAPTAEVSVVPVFRKLASYIINYKQIPPDYVRDND
ncbi:MAG: peptidoglycan D,D-transpeptidase FtsI family protein [Patescibacteria group bacterium]